MIYKIYYIKEFLKKITPSFVKKIIPQHLRGRLYSKIFPFYFIPTDHDELPKSNFIDNYNSISEQIKFIDQFNSNFKQNSEMTFPNLIELLQTKFNKDEKFSFLDIGGEYVDFYLDLNKNFKNVKYFLLNIKSINETFKELKTKYNFNNLYVLDEIKQVSNKQFDFINLGASIQYIKAYEVILDNIGDKHSSILFSGIPVYRTNNKKYEKFMIVRQARNSVGNYLYFFNKDYFCDYLKNKQFSITLEKKNSTDNVNFNNFRSIVDEIEYLDLMFEKKK
tara:strand:+ start:1429 stop:2262 length:834 start_codon:yes stop_codon:yes gene_type:complete